MPLNKSLRYVSFREESSGVWRMGREGKSKGSALLGSPKHLFPADQLSALEALERRDYRRSVASPPSAFWLPALTQTS